MCPETVVAIASVASAGASIGSVIQASNQELPKIPTSREPPPTPQRGAETLARPSAIRRRSQSGNNINTTALTIPRPPVQL